MRPTGLNALARASGVATVLLASLAPAVLLTGCGGGGGGGSDPEFGAQALTVVDMDLDGLDGVSLNQPLTIEFSEYVSAASIRPDTIQIRLGPRYGIQSFGEFRVQGNIVTFYPRLPTLATLSDAGFQPDSEYKVTVVGYPKVNHVAAYTGRPLTRTFVGSFATAADTDPEVFTIDTYKDNPPPAVRFTNPSDVIPQSPWTVAGGAVNVPTDATLSAVLFRVPLLPSTVTTGNVSLTMIERYGVLLAPPRPIQGTPVLEQTFDSVSLRFVPTFPLADQARYVLRIENRVTDLTGNYDLADNSARTALRTLYDGGTDAALVDFIEGTGAWAGIPHPEEVDPRTFLIFTTRDEPVKDATYFLNFDGTDRDQNGGDGMDANNTTASFNTAIAGAVAATFTAAGGTGANGNFIPIANTTLNTNASTITNGVFNFRQITINANITVTVTGTLPATLNSLRDVTIAGILGATGGPGDASEQNYTTSSIPLAKGGAGQAGGGNGADCYNGTSQYQRGPTGDPGANGGGGGGQGGTSPQTTVYAFGGGGGGGGHQYAGLSGGSGSYPSYSSWNGTGGAGGAAGGIQPTSPNTGNGNLFYQKGVGGGGGGAGGNSAYYPNSWRNGAAGGGGGGGGICLKSAGNIRILGQVIAKGGKGGDSGQYYYYGGAGGGGGGGAIALYASDTLDIRNATLDTSGGPGGALGGTGGWGGAGGKGGGGYVQLEALNATTKIVGTTGAGAASILPDYYTGTFNPVGTSLDAPSIFTSTWFNMGVFDPVLQAPTAGDFIDQNFADCTISYEIQMSREDPTNFGKADTSSINVQTGASSDLTRASQWATINDSTNGVQDVTGQMNGYHYQFYRVRISFTLKDGQTRTDPVPYVDRMRLRVKY